MPSREDERWLNLSGKHASACTCVKCVESHLKRHQAGGGTIGFLRRLFGRR